jgi:purine nucleosidase
VTKIHLDTDLGGDIDDLCALAMLLRWPGVELTGITTVGDDRGRRAGYVRYVLGMEGRGEIPVKAGAAAYGADLGGAYFRYEMGLPAEQRYWPEPIPASPNPEQEAVQLLRRSVEQGATIVAIGPLTNLRLLDVHYPGSLRQAKLFLMGGYIFPPRPGFPNWENEMDFNIQADVRSAMHVLQNGNPTLVPLSVTIETALRRAYLPDLRKSGPLGELLARQAEAFAEDEQYEAKYGATCQGLPNDTINFLHDPLALAIALGWDEGVRIQELPLSVEEKAGWLVERVSESGRAFNVVTEVDARRFDEFWLRRIMIVQKQL